MNNNKPVLYAGNDEKSYDEWYAEQYLAFYGDYEREKNQNENALRPITLNRQHQHYGAGQNGYNMQKGHKHGQEEQEEDEDEDIDLNYHRNQMNTSMNNRRERKRIFRHFENQNHDGFNQYNPNKKRKFNYCSNNKMSLYQS